MRAAWARRAAEEIVSYFHVTRQVGHTTAQREGWVSRPEAVVVVGDHATARRLAVYLGGARPRFSKNHFVPLDSVADGGLRPLAVPLVVEHSAVAELLGELLSEVRTAEREVASTAETVAQLHADVAHRDRALLRLAEILSLVGGAAPRVTVDDVMRATASSRPAERPLRITTAADVAPLLKALDELSCALRGIARPETKANGGEA